MVRPGNARALVFNIVGKVLLSLFLSALLTSAQSMSAKYEDKHLPEFEDFPVSEVWNQGRKPLQLANASERMFKARLSPGAKEPPNFAGKFRLVFWGCGSVCHAGAMIDLESGEVFSLPLVSENKTGWEK